MLSSALSSIVPANLRPAISRPELCPVARPQRNSIRSQNPAPSPSAVSRCPVSSQADYLPVMASKTRHTPDQRWPALDIKTFTYQILTESWGHCVSVTLSCNGRDVWEINTGAWKLDSESCFSLQPAAVASSSFYIMIMGPSACESFHRVLIVSLKALVA